MTRYKTSDSVIKVSSLILENGGTLVHIKFSNSRVFSNNPGLLEMNGELKDDTWNYLKSPEVHAMNPNAKLRLLVSITSDRIEDAGKPTTIKVVKINSHDLTVPSEAQLTTGTTFTVPASGSSANVCEINQEITFPAKWIRSALPAPSGSSPFPVINDVWIQTTSTAGSFLGSRCLHTDGYLGFAVTPPFMFVHGANDAGKVWYLPQTKTIGDGQTGTTTHQNIMEYFTEAEQSYLCYSTNINLGWAIPFFGQYTGAGTLAKNAKQLGKQLKIEAARFGTSQVHLICHSKGGLDSRKLLSSDGYHKDYEEGKLHIRSIATIGTPHWGSPLADATLAFWAFHQIDGLDDSNNSDPGLILVRQRVYQLMDELAWYREIGIPIVPSAIGTLNALSTNNMQLENKKYMKTEDMLEDYKCKLVTIAGDADLNGDGEINRFEGAGEPGMREKYDPNGLTNTFTWPILHNFNDTDFNAYKWQYLYLPWSAKNDFLDLHYKINLTSGWTFVPGSQSGQYTLTKTNQEQIQSEADKLNDLRVPVYSARYKPSFLLGSVRPYNHVLLRNRDMGFELVKKAMDDQSLDITFEPEAAR